MATWIKGLQAVAFAMKEFLQFLFGLHFKIYTDHKPLLGLLSPERATPLMHALEQDAALSIVSACIRIRAALSPG